MSVAAGQAASEVKGRVLLVDDEPDCLFLCEKYLQHAGHATCTALNGEEALRKAETFGPTLIVLDCMMPEMDGLELTRRFRAGGRFDGTPILMLTALTGLRDKMAGYRAGVNDYLTKPFEAAELVLRVNSFLASTERQQLTLEREKFEVLQQTATAVAHHVNNPLQTILTGVDLLRETESPAERERLLLKIRDRAIAIGKLMNKLTRTNRIVSTVYVGSEKMIDIEASAAELSPETGELEDRRSAPGAGSCWSDPGKDQSARTPDEP